MKHKVMVVVVGLYLLTAAAVFANSMGWSPLKKGDAQIQPTNSQQSPSSDSGATPWEPFQPSASKLEFFTITPSEPEVQPESQGEGDAGAQSGSGNRNQQPAGSPTMRDALGGGGQEQPSRARRRPAQPAPETTTEPVVEPTTQQMPRWPSLPATTTGDVGAPTGPEPTTATQ